MTHEDPSLSREISQEFLRRGGWSADRRRTPALAHAEGAAIQQNPLHLNDDAANRRTLIFVTLPRRQLHDSAKPQETTRRRDGHDQSRLPRASPEPPDMAELRCAAGDQFCIFDYTIKDGLHSPQICSSGRSAAWQASVLSVGSGRRNYHPANDPSAAMDRSTWLRLRPWRILRYLRKADGMVCRTGGILRQQHAGKTRRSIRVGRRPAHMLWLCYRRAIGLPSLHAQKYPNHTSTYTTAVFLTPWAATTAISSSTPSRPVRHGHRQLWFVPNSTSVCPTGRKSVPGYDFLETDRNAERHQGRVHDAPPLPRGSGEVISATRCVYPHVAKPDAAGYGDRKQRRKPDARAAGTRSAATRGSGPGNSLRSGGRRFHPRSRAAVGRLGARCSRPDNVDKPSECQTWARVSGRPGGRRRFRPSPRRWQGPAACPRSRPGGRWAGERDRGTECRKGQT